MKRQQNETDFDASASLAKEPLGYAPYHRPTLTDCGSIRALTGNNYSYFGGTDLGPYSNSIPV